MKKTSMKLIALSLALSMFLVACGNTQTSNETKATSKSTNESTSEVSNGVKTITVALQSDSFVSDYDDNYFTNMIEEKIGAEIEFYLLPSDPAELRTKVSLLIQGGQDIPDVFIVNNALTQETILDYGSKGAFIPLNDYVSDAKAMPNFNAIPGEDKTKMLDAMVAADGNMYGMVKYEPETWNLTPYRFYINEAWLKAVGMETPTTTDEYYEVLKAFRDQDPNGNGIKDEIGVYGYASGGYGQNVTMALMNAFVFYNGGSQNGGLSLEGNTVIAPFATEGWKSGIEYLNKLYSEQLLAASIFTDDDTQFKATLNSETNIVGSVTAGSTSVWTDVNKNANFQEMAIMKPLQGPTGLAYTPYSDYVPTPNLFVSSSCEDVELAIKLADIFYDSTVSTTSRFGEEGVDWVTDEAVLKNYTNSYIEAGIYEKAGLVYLTPIWTETTNVTWHNINPRYASLEFMNTVANGLVPFDSSLKSVMLNAFCYEHYFPAHPENLLPVLKYTLEEAEVNSEIITNVTEYVNQSLAEFITGSRPISDWDNYIKELNNMGLQDWLAAAQSAYERAK